MPRNARAGRQSRIDSPVPRAPGIRAWRSISNVERLDPLLVDRTNAKVLLFDEGMLGRGEQGGRAFTRGYTTCMKPRAAYRVAAVLAPLAGLMTVLAALDGMWLLAACGAIATTSGLSNILSARRRGISWKGLRPSGSSERCDRSRATVPAVSLGVVAPDAEPPNRRPAPAMFDPALSKHEFVEKRQFAGRANREPGCLARAE